MKVVANDEFGLWEVHDDAGFVCAVESKSTAVVFASAHDLLEALEFIVNDVPSPGEDAELTAVGYNKACAAIAMAKGNRDLLESPAKHVVRIRFGCKMTREEVYGDEHPYDEFVFNTNEEANAFLEGVSAMDGWMEFEQVDDEASA